MAGIIWTVLGLFSDAMILTKVHSRNAEQGETDKWPVSTKPSYLNRGEGSKLSSAGIVTSITGSYLWQLLLSVSREEGAGGAQPPGASWPGDDVTETEEQRRSERT